MSSSEAEFEVAVTAEDCHRFAGVSGDWNPLHTDADYAAASVYRRQVLHGAFSAGLISRLAGMYLPGKNCLLHGLHLRFVAPILPPSNLRVSGRLMSTSIAGGLVEASVIDAATGTRYVDASYEFGYHQVPEAQEAVDPEHKPPAGSNAPLILVTGASGGIGAALIRRLGVRAHPVTRESMLRGLNGQGISALTGTVGDGRISAIVHCAWPAPDNRRLIDIDLSAQVIEHNVSNPLREIHLLAALLAKHGDENASLILIGSTYAESGRHYFRMPLYSIAKSTIPTVVKILAIELASTSRRCIGVVFDVIDGGMNKGISASARLANADRSPWGQLPTPDEAAAQIVWLLENQSSLISGATVTLSAGAIP